MLQHRDQPRLLLGQLVLQPLHQPRLQPQLEAHQFRVLNRDLEKCLGALTQSSDLVIILKVMQELPEVVTLRLAPAPLTLALMVQGVQPHVLQGKAGKNTEIII